MRFVAFDVSLMIDPFCHFMVQSLDPRQPQRHMQDRRGHHIQSHRGLGRLQPRTFVKFVLQPGFDH